MTAGAAHLVDAVLPDVPIRQWVLTVPHHLRYLLAWRHDLCKGVVRIVLREVQRHLRARAREQGLVDVRGGAVAIVQRFGGALNLNVHVHALVLDGVFAREGQGQLRCHPAPALDSADEADVLAAIIPGVQRLAQATGKRSVRPDRRGHLRRDHAAAGGAGRRVRAGPAGCVYQKVNLPHQSAFGLRHLNARVRGRSRCRAVIVPAR